MANQSKSIEAIDLFIQDIKTPNNEIRILAKKQNCEQELTVWRDYVLDYLQNIRDELQGNSKL